MKAIRNTVIFWLLLVGLAFGQERRDPTLPGPAIGQRLAKPLPAQPDAPKLSFKLKALVLHDADHGMALLETTAGTVKVVLRREQPTELKINEARYLVRDFDARSVKLEHIGASEALTGSE